MKHAIFLIASLLFSLSANGQSALKLSGKSLPELRSESRKTLLLNPTSYTPEFRRAKAAAPAPSYPTLRESLAIAASPKAWRYCDLAFFCKIEVRMEKAIKFPFKVRLGETQEVERMEGKLGNGEEH